MSSRAHSSTASGRSSWRLAGHSVRGASHVHGGLPNQDALGLWQSQEGDGLAVAAVADGHGGARHFRSATGARIAVDVCLHTLREAGRRIIVDAEPLTTATQAMEDLPRQIVARWTAAAHADLAANPIGDEEWKGVRDAEGDDALATVRADPLLAYGATLLSMLATPHCLVLLQLGDGDILAVYDDGGTTRPVAADARLAGNFTTSICRARAEDDFRSALIATSDRQVAGANAGAAPVMFLLSTDGYANSFRTDADFLVVGKDFDHLVRSHGLTAVNEQLPSILADASHQGSGDDITLAIVRRDAPTMAPVPPADPASHAGNAGQAGIVSTNVALAIAEGWIAKLTIAMTLLAVALLVLSIWTWQHGLGRLFHRDPKLPESALSPSLQEPRLPSPQRLQPVTDASTGVASGGVAGTLNGTVVVEDDKAAPVDFERPQAYYVKDGIEVRFGLTGPPARLNGCVAHVAISSQVKELASVHTTLPASMSIRPEVKLRIDYPMAAKKSKKETAVPRVSARVECADQLVARIDSIALSAQAPTQGGS